MARRRIELERDNVSKLTMIRMRYGNRGYNRQKNTEMKKVLGWSPALNTFKTYRSEGAPFRTALKLAFGKR